MFANFLFEAQSDNSSKSNYLAELYLHETYSELGIRIILVSIRRMNTIITDQIHI